MLKLNKRFRSQYFNESIITEKIYENGQWTTVTETVQNSVINNQISNQAVVFGNGLSRLAFNHNLIVNHKGGMLGSNKLQTYGCNAVYRDFKVDFLVASSRTIVQEIIQSGYSNDNIIYTGILNALEFPSKFYLVPNDPYADAGTTATYIAAFDGHQKIFLLGFDGQDTPNFNHNVYAGTNGYDPIDFNTTDAIWAENMYQVMSVYNNVDFVHVSETGFSPIPEKWKYLPNVRKISFRDFVIEASL
jgi:hypothetical protein